MSNGNRVVKMVESRNTISRDFMDAFQLSTTRDELIEIRQYVLGWQDIARRDVDDDVVDTSLLDDSGTIVPARVAEECFAALVEKLDRRFDRLGLKRVGPKMKRPKKTRAQLAKQVCDENRAARKMRQGVKL
jgi:hypothetical protein